jgi:hypothetical protein
MTGASVMYVVSSVMSCGVRTDGYYQPRLA